MANLRATASGRVQAHKTHTTKQRVYQTLVKMRRGQSLRQATRAAGTTPRTVQRYAGKKLERTARGRFSVRRADHRIRHMRFLAPDGLITLAVRGSESASRVADYWNAVHHYLRFGDISRLYRFRGQRLQSQGKRYPFITDTTLLDRLAYAGEVRFEDIYQLAA